MGVDGNGTFDKVLIEGCNGREDIGEIFSE